MPAPAINIALDLQAEVQHLGDAVADLRVAKVLRLLWAFRHVAYESAPALARDIDQFGAAGDQGPPPIVEPAVERPTLPDRPFATPWSHTLTTEEITGRYWRQGGSTGRAIYCGEGDGAAIGWMDTPGLTAAVVMAHNRALDANPPDDPTEAPLPARVWESDWLEFP